jgi:RNA polymerase sigma-70 factor (ECF subfamily)
MPSESALVEKGKMGNQRAFKLLFERNVEKLYRFLRQFTKNSDEVEDWVQRAFIKAFINIDKFQERSKFSTWLIRIGINEMRTDFRKNDLFRSTGDEGEEIYLQLYLQEQAFEWEHDMKIYLNELEETKRAVFILYEVEGYSHAEISEMLEISESSSRTNLHRAKKLLQSSISNRKDAI